MLVVGCSSPEPIYYETTLIERDGVWYTKDTNKPYSGDVFSLDENGQIKVEVTLKDGRVWNGKWTEWHENGQKKSEGTFKDGELIESTEWQKDGYEFVPYRDSIPPKAQESGQWSQPAGDQIETEPPTGN